MKCLDTNSNTGVASGSQKLQNADERDQRSPKRMEKCTVFLDLKTQHREDVKSPQIYLWV